MAQTREPDIVLEATNVSKKFSYSLRKSKRYIVSRLLRGAFGVPVDSSELRPTEFWAVKDVSFDLKRGETLGLIGPNGAGKSTILKMINGLFLPDNGEIKVSGKVGALIELGAGFHPLLSGRENIYIKGAILGKKKREVDELFDEIVEFADLGKFIDSPVNTYSSGMYVRLGFAVAVYNNPDVLLVDEILAVGDFTFKQKCFSKINELKDKMSIVFISHNMIDIVRFCDHAAVLDEGVLKYNGKTQDAVRYYLDEVEGKEKRKKTKKVEETLSLRSYFGDLFRNNRKITDVIHRWATPNGEPVDSIKHNQTIILEFSFRLVYKPKNLLIGVPIWDEHGNYITSINSDANEVNIPIGPNGLVRGRMIVDRLMFNPGVYTSVLAVVDGKETIYRQILNSFRVEEMVHSFGFVTLNADWRFE